LVVVINLLICIIGFWNIPGKLGAGFVTLPQMTGRRVGMPFVLAWAGMPKTSFRKNSDSPQFMIKIF
jgi:hypothetical protein